MNCESLALVALGANLDDPGGNLLRAFKRLAALSNGPMRRSSLWRSAPVGCPPGSPWFVNAAAAFGPLPGETPESLLAKLQEIERAFGRTHRHVVNEPRTLDLDLIAFGDETRSAGPLILPHPRAHGRRFVLQPLAEIVPDFVLPGQQSTIAALLAALPGGEAVTRLQETGGQGTPPKAGAQGS